MVKELGDARNVLGEDKRTVADGTSILDQDVLGDLVFAAEELPDAVDIHSPVAAPASGRAKKESAKEDKIAEVPGSDLAV